MTTQNVFDAIGAGTEVAGITPVEKLLIFTFAPPVGFNPYYDGVANFSTFGRIRVYGTISPSDPFDFTAASYADAPTWIAGGLRVDVSGEFLYMDAQLSAFQIAEYYIRFDDAETVFPIRPGTVLQKRFKRFEVVAIQVENPTVLQTTAETNGSFAAEIAQHVRFYAGFGLAMHARPDLRVKVSDVAANLALATNQNVQVLNTQVSGVSARVVGELNGIPGPFGFNGVSGLDTVVQVTAIPSGGNLQAMIFDGADALLQLFTDAGFPLETPVMARYNIRILVDWTGNTLEPIPQFSLSVHSFSQDDPLLAEDGYADVIPGSFGTAGYAKQVHAFKVVNNADFFTADTGSGKEILNETFFAPLGLTRRVLVNGPGILGEAATVTFTVFISCGVVGTPEVGVDYIP